jgi:glutaredoxin
VFLRKSRSRRFFVVVAITALAWLGGPSPARSAAVPFAVPETVEVEVFVREGCPHCADAEAVLEKLHRERPTLVVTVRDVAREPEALVRLEKLLAARQGRAASVPTFVIRGELLVGFVDEATTGARIREMLAGNGTDTGSIMLPWINRRISIDHVGLPLFTVAIGLLDGFNPCSMWVLVMMVSMLVAVGDRRRMIAVAGTFVAVEGIAYFAFMVAWLNLFMFIGVSRASEIILGAIAIGAGLVNAKDFVAFGRGFSLSIPASAKPGIYQRMRRVMHERSLAVAIVGTVVLAVLVQFVELLCTSGLPALYTRILTLRRLDPWSYYGYVLLYNVMYVLDDIIVLVVGVITLSQRRLQQKEGRLLKLLSGVVMLGLGVYLILSPR